MAYWWLAPRPDPTPSAPPSTPRTQVGPCAHCGSDLEFNLHFKERPQDWIFTPPPPPPSSDGDGDGDGDGYGDGDGDGPPLPLSFHFNILMRCENRIGLPPQHQQPGSASASCMGYDQFRHIYRRFNLHDQEVDLTDPRYLKFFALDTTFPAVALEAALSASLLREVQSTLSISVPPHCCLHAHIADFARRLAALSRDLPKGFVGLHVSAWLNLVQVHYDYYEPPDPFDSDSDYDDDDDDDDNHPEDEAPPAFDDAPPPPPIHGGGDLLPDVAPPPPDHYGLQTTLFTNQTPAQNCTICTDDFLHQVHIITLPCSHVYHTPCILRWLQQQPNCPLCRHPVPPLPPG